MDHTANIIRLNLSRINLLAIDASLLFTDSSRHRIERLLQHFQRWDLARPLVMLAVRNDIEHAAAKDFSHRLSGVAECVIVQRTTNGTIMGLALKLFEQRIDSVMAGHLAKRHILVLGRRGGAGEAKFVRPFTGGQGTTCGAWTPVVSRMPDGTHLKGFMLAAVTHGFCPVECPFCYLQSLFNDGMTVNLNWEDLGEELRTEWAGYPYPINFCEVSGFVEYDEWFADPNGEGSMVQFAIDACAAAQATAFFLTKIRYPRYLKFKGQVQVGISLMPEMLRVVHAPHGSPSSELLESLAWAVSAGAVDPVIRLFFLWEHRELYLPLLARARELLGTTGWRITLDIPRFTPATLSAIAKRHPNASADYLKELAAGANQTIQQLVSESRTAKKVRPPLERQATMYRWLRTVLDDLGCSEVSITACKGDPEELLPLVREGLFDAMPCACHKCPSKRIQP